MTSTRLLTLLAFVFLLGSCGGGGGDSSRNVIDSPPEPPQDGVSGKVQSSVSGAVISVTDANGQDVTIASGRLTNASGRYRLVFSEFAIAQGIVAPLIITVDGSGAQAICDYNRDGDNDCLDADGTYVAYGETYTLADNFILRGMAPSFPPESTAGDRRVTVNVSAASDIATQFALDNGETTLSEAGVRAAMSQALGFVEFITGLPTSGVDLNSISIPDMTEALVPDTASLAVGLFAAGIHGQVSPTAPARANYRGALNQIQSRISVNQVTGLAEGTGSFLSETVNNYLTAAISFQNSLAVASPVLEGAIASQFITLQLLDALGSNTVAISTPAAPGDTAPLERTKTLVNRLTEAMGATRLISQTVGFGGTPTGAATVYADQVSLLEILASSEVRNTMLLLDEALAEAIVTGETQLTGTNVSGVLAFEDNTVVITTATSTTSNIQTGVSVNISIQDGRRNNPGGNGQYNIQDITIGVTQTQNDVTTQELFEGTARITMRTGTSGVDATDLHFAGELRGQSGLAFTGDMTMSALSPVGAAVADSNYVADFAFAGQSDLNLAGTLSGGISTHTVSTDGGTILTDIETGVITDMSADLNLTLDAATGTVVTGGILTADGVQTGQMDAFGIVGFEDGTAVVLPVPVI